MSKTYRKHIRLGNAYGSNTEFYRDRNRSIRNKNRGVLHNLQYKNIQPEGLADELDQLMFHEPKKRDPWFEPTDGSKTICMKDLRKEIENAESERNFEINTGTNCDRYGTGWRSLLLDKLRRVFKPKHYKYYKS